MEERPHQIISATVARRQRATQLARALRGTREHLWDGVEAVCNSHDVQTPGVWLAELMAGVDPRMKSSRLLEAIRAVVERGPSEQPTPDEWSEIVELVVNDPRWGREGVPLDYSERAARTLLPVLYPVRAPEVSHDGSDAGEADRTLPACLTPAECEAYDQWFETKYGSPK